MLRPEDEDNQTSSNISEHKPIQKKGVKACLTDLLKNVRILTNQFERGVVDFTPEEKIKIPLASVGFPLQLVIVAITKDNYVECEIQDPYGEITLKDRIKAFIPELSRLLIHKLDAIVYKILAENSD